MSISSLGFVRRLAAWAFATVVSACAPSFDVDLSALQSEQVLALRAEPAEAEPGETVTLSALVAGADAMGEVDFGLCTARKDLAELGPIAPECLRPKSKAIAALGQGASVLATLPEDACSLFGPKRPDPKPGEPAGRPADPDPTGGYYQPVIARLSDSEFTLGGVRLACGLQRADREQVERYNRQWRANQNPQPEQLALSIGGTWTRIDLPPAPGLQPSARDAGALRDGGSDAGDSDAQALGVDGAQGPSPAGAEPEVRAVVQRGADVELRVSWKACPREVSTDSSQPVASASCGGAEAYLLYDSAARVLQERREQLVVSWYSSAGQLATHRTAPSSPNASQDANTWRAPSTRGDVRLWVVIRDGRGGVGWGSVTVSVR